MARSHRERVGRALELLEARLARCVERELKITQQDRVQREAHRHLLWSPCGRVDWMERSGIRVIGSSLPLGFAAPRIPLRFIRRRFLLPPSSSPSLG